MHSLPIVPPQRPDEGIILGWMLFVPVMLFMMASAIPVWHATTLSSPFVRVPLRSFYLAYFFTPSLVGAAGPTGGFLLPGPAFLMLTFGQWYLKVMFGVLPIAICFAIILPSYLLLVRLRRHS